MAKVQFRTASELDRAQWADKFTSVAEGTLYKESNSPFTVHEYFKLGLLGKEIRMLELNAGAALIDQMVADAVTDLNISSKEEGSKASEEIKEWHKENFYEDVLEETARSFFANGYAVQQVVRDVSENGKENIYRIITLASKTWYPTIPTFRHQNVSEGRVISILCEVVNATPAWYAFVEKHSKGIVENALYKLENSKALEGTKVDLGVLSRFQAVVKSVKTDLDHIPIFQINMTKGAGKYFGQSIFVKIWGNLQEISEIKTQMRMERIKHFRSLLAVPVATAQRAQRVDNSDGSPQNSKETRSNEQQAVFDMRQEVMAIPTGAEMPLYIQKDLEIIKTAMAMIKDCLSEIASVTGCPRSIFNLDEKGTIHVATEKKKDRRYMQRINQCQRKLEWITEQGAKIYFEWNKKKDQGITAELDSAFEMTMEEKVDLYRKMNRDGNFISTEKAIRLLFPDMPEEEVVALVQQIKDEDQATANAFAPPPVVL